MTTHQPPFADMTEFLLEKMTAADLLGLLARTMTELDQRGAQLRCGNPACRPAYGTESFAVTIWATVHSHDDGYHVNYYTDEALDQAVSAERDSTTKMRISDETMVAVRERTDIVALVRENVPLEAESEIVYRGPCPRHNDPEYSLRVHASKQAYMCRCCGQGGDAITWLMDRDHLSFEEVVTVLAERAGVALAYQPIPEPVRVPG